jgi:hypothetical protein
VADVLLPALVVAFVANTLAWAWVAMGWRRMADGLAADGLAADGLCEPVPEPAEEPGPPSPSAAVSPVPFSVVAAARDEAARLPVLLRALRQQTHRDAAGRALFEIVVVDDRSADDTAALVERTAAGWTATTDPALRLVRVSEPEAADGGPVLPPKKRALTAGIIAARHDRLALTDADTEPPPTWLATLARHAAPGGADDGAVLVGFAPLAPRPGMLNRFIRYETLQTAALAAAGIGWGRPWHATGRNLSYPRSLFERVGGFAATAGSLSGDDDLFVQHVAGTAEVRYVPDAAAHVPSPAPDGWGAFVRQRRRHASAGTHYTPGVLIGLGVLHVSAGVLWLGAPLLHALTGAPTGWGFVALHLLVQRAALARPFDAFGAAPDVRLAQPLLDLAGTLYQAAAAVASLFPAPKRW